jgi:hypothetical protein
LIVCVFYVAPSLQRGIFRFSLVDGTSCDILGAQYSLGPARADQLARRVALAFSGVPQTSVLRLRVKPLSIRCGYFSCF